MKIYFYFLFRHNTDSLIAIGLNLISVVIECGSSHLCRFPALAGLVQDNLCKNLFRVSGPTDSISASKYTDLSVFLLNSDHKDTDKFSKILKTGGNSVHTYIVYGALCKILKMGMFILKDRRAA